ncbi:MAG TPA: hypothetical protein DC054_09410 [Blastocatellia bacterium]|nr:hypothetical protein [Blastocatellia bacterium]
MECSPETALGLLRDWRDRGLFLLALLEAAEDRLLLKGVALVKDLSEDALTLTLEQSELTLNLRDITYTSLESSDGPPDFAAVVTGTILQVRFPGFRLSLAVLRKQPLIHWRDDA